MLDVIDERLSSLHIDPLWRLLVDRLRIRTCLRAIVLAWALGFFTTFIIPAFTGHLWPDGSVISPLQDWPSFLINFLTAPLVYAYYCCEQPDMVSRLRQNLHANVEGLRYDGQSGRETTLFLRVTGQLLWRGRFVALMLIAAAGAGIWVWDVLRHTQATYYDTPRIVLAVHIVRVALPLYMMLVMVIRHALVTLALFVYFRSYKPTIHALHPDRCGGLAFLGRFSLRGAYLIAVVALNITFQMLHNSEILGLQPFQEYSLALAGVAYLLVAPFAFFLPLTPAHEGMREAKEAAEKLVSDAADKLYKSIQNDLRQQTVNGDLIARLDDLHRLSKLTNEFPVWPLDVGTLSRIATAVLLPLIPPLIIVLIEKIAQALT